MAISKIGLHANEPKFNTGTFDLLVFKANSGPYGHCTGLKMDTAVRKQMRSETWKSGLAENMYMGTVPLTFWCSMSFWGFDRAVKQMNINKLEP